MRDDFAFINILFIRILLIYLSLLTVRNGHKLESLCYIGAQSNRMCYNLRILFYSANPVNPNNLVNPGLFDYREFTCASVSVSIACHVEV